MPRSYATDAALRPQPRRTGLDDWATPDSLCTALAEHILPTLPAGLIWEPAAGAGALVAAMRAAGRRVAGTIDPVDGRTRDYLSRPASPRCRDSRQSCAPGAA